MGNQRFSWASNPCRLIERYQETKRERFLSDAELVRLGEVLAQAEGAEMPGVLAALRLLAATGCRLGEVLALRWDDVDLEASALHIRDPKNRTPRAHPIGAMVVALLSELPHTGPWVVHGRDTRKPLSEGTLEGAWLRLRDHAGLADVRMHDLRHTVGTVAGATGANAFLIRDALGHKTVAMTGRYVNRDADPLRELVGKVESRIMGALNAGGGAAAGKGADPDRVVPLQTARKRP